MALRLAQLLVVIALVGIAPTSGVANEEYLNLNEGALVTPIEEIEVTEDQPDDRDQPEETQEKAPGQDAVDEMRQDVDGATSVDQVKSSMSNTIQKAMAEKKADLLAKASKAADEKTEKLAEAEAEKKARLKIADEEDEAKERERQREAKSKASDHQEEKAQLEMDDAKKDLVRSSEKKSVMHNRKVAEEEAKTATARRIAAEEKAKTAAAERVASEEEAKKAAALSLTQKEQSQAAEKSPLELHAMEAKAFQQAAELKIKEGEALGKVANLKKGSDMRHREDGDMGREAASKASLHEAKVKLHHLVEQATAALFEAKAKPFDKAALQNVISMKDAVTAAKAEVVRLSGTLTTEREAVHNDEEEIKGEYEKHEDLHHDEGTEDDSDKAKGEKNHAMEEKVHDMQHPDLKHLSDKEIKYWANKKMDWRVEDPMDKNKVMAKIFQLKNMEAETLTKMNEVNTQIGMNSTGVRASMLGKGESVIVDGQLVKPNPSFHLRHTFQGQKGRDPKTEDNGRDQERDALKAHSPQDLEDHMTAMNAATDQEIEVAVAARTAPYAPPGDKSATVSGLSDLKMAVKNNVKYIDPENQTPDERKGDDSVKAEAEEDTEEPNEADQPTMSLGEDNEDNNMTSLDNADEQQDEALVEKEDDDELADENDVDEEMDETSMDDDEFIDQPDRSA